MTARAGGLLVDVVVVRRLGAHCVLEGAMFLDAQVVVGIVAARAKGDALVCLRYWKTHAFLQIHHGLFGIV